MRISLAQLKTKIETDVKVPYFYGRALNGTKLPYVVAIDNGSSNFEADNKVFYPVQGIQLELYTVSKDETLEASIESVLNDLELPYEKIESVDEDENFFLNTYTFTR